MPHDPKTLLPLMQLEARRNFLHKHAKAVNSFRADDLESAKAPYLLANDAALYEGYPETLSDLDSVKDMHTHKISQIEEYLQSIKHAAKKGSTTDLYLEAVLLTRDLIKSDGEGVSRTLGKHFAPLVGDRIPFVNLDSKSGLMFYFHTAADAECFSRILATHGINGASKAEKLPEDLLNTDAAKMREDYQSDNTTVVAIRHCDIERLFDLEQRHPYQYTESADDMYKSKEYNRSECLVEEAQQQSQSDQAVVDITKIEKTTIGPHEKVLIGVTLSAQMKTPQDHHEYVVIFDDSGSMQDGNSIGVANEALRSFVRSLPANDRVSVLPLNSPCYHKRVKASELADLFTEIPASGTTPLYEAMAHSGKLLKAHPSDLLISQHRLENSTLLVWTDGAPNEGTVDRLLGYMKDCSAPISEPPSMKNDPSSSYNSSISWGLPGFTCAARPLVMVTEIGTRASSGFTNDMSNHFKAPFASVSAGAGMREQMNNVNETVKILGAGHTTAPAVLGLSYTNGSGKHTVTAQADHLIFGCERHVYFELPEDASDVTCTLVHGSTHTTTQRITDPANKTAMVNNYVEGQLVDISLGKQDANEAATCRINIEKHSNELQRVSEGLDDFETFMSQLENAIKNPVQCSRRGGRGSSIRQVEPFYAKYASQNGERYELSSTKDDIYSDLQTRKTQLESQIAQDKAKLATQSDEDTSSTGKLTKLMECVIDNQSLTQRIDLEIKRIASKDARSFSAHHGQVNRAAVASFTQQRYAQTTGQSRLSTPLLTAVQNLDEDQVRRTLAMQTASHGMPLLAALRKKREILTEGTDSDCTATITAIIEMLIPHTEMEMQDDGGNTVLHYAAFHGFSHELTLMTSQLSDEQLVRLETCRNKNVIGATLGETIADNVRHGRLEDTFKKDILQQLTPQARRPSGYDENNRHSNPEWNTVLMDRLSSLREATGDDKIDQRQRVLNFIRENRLNLCAQNYNGNTALHFALWNAEFEVALAILNAALKQGKPALQDVLSARNRTGETHLQDSTHQYHSGGEVPSMNLSSRYTANFSDELILNTLLEECAQKLMTEVPDEFNQWQIENLHKYCEAKDTGTDKYSQLQVASDLIEFARIKLTKDGSNEKIIEDIYKKIRSIHLFTDVVTFLLRYLRPACQVELRELNETYQRQLEGCDPYHYLRSTPVLALHNIHKKAKLRSEDDMKILADNLHVVLYDGETDVAGEIVEWLLKDRRMNHSVAQAKILLKALSELKRFMAKVTPVPEAADHPAPSMSPR